MNHREEISRRRNGQRYPCAFPILRAPLRVAAKRDIANHFSSTLNFSASLRLCVRSFFLLFNHCIPLFLLCIFASSRKILSLNSPLYTLHFPFRISSLCLCGSFFLSLFLSPLPLLTWVAAAYYFAKREPSSIASARRVRNAYNSCGSQVYRELDVTT